MDMVMGRRDIIWKTPTVTANGLKNFACAMMLLQTVSRTIIQNGMIHLGRYTQESLAAAMESDRRLVMLAGIGSVLELFGGLALPLFAFLLVEGFYNTSDLKKYLLSIVSFAVVSEIPYDLAVSMECWDLSGQNALFTMAVCLLMLYFLDVVRTKKSAGRSFLQILIIFCAVVWVTLLRAQYGACMVLLTAVFYIFRTRNVLKTVLGMLISLLYVTGPLAFYGIWCYNEQRRDRCSKYVYYAFYPIHLLAAGSIVRFFMS